MSPQYIFQYLVKILWSDWLSVFKGSNAQIMNWLSNYTKTNFNLTKSWHPVWSKRSRKKRQEAFLFPRAKITTQIKILEAREPSSVITAGPQTTRSQRDKRLEEACLGAWLPGGWEEGEVGGQTRGWQQLRLDGNLAIGQRLVSKQLSTLWDAWKRLSDGFFQDFSVFGVWRWWQ